MKRSKHNLSNYRLTTLDMGQLVPVQMQEVLPGDSMQLETSALVRCSPMLAPVMHPTTIRFHHWFVPSRLLWDKWEDFITGGQDNQNADTIPQIVLTQGMIDSGLPDYFGIPPVVGLSVNALPFRAYNKIYNEFYRDEDLIPTEITEDNIAVQKVSWGQDYFTSARPWPQKGTAITMPLGSTAPLAFQGTTSLHNMVGAKNFQASGATAPVITDDADVLNGANAVVDLSQATGISAIEFREFFALQRYAEARSKHGSKYAEYLKYLGINPSDSRLQRPEYLGGGKSKLQFSEVLQTAVDVTDPVGTMRGHGISALKTRSTRKYFEEHGYVITLMSVVPKSLYQDGVQRTWLKLDKEDFFQKELQGIGAQPVLQGEIDCSVPANVQDTFGYTSRYNDYTWTPSQVSGDFRTTLDHWHMGRKFATPPALNQSFIDCEPSKRIFAEQTTNPLWVMVNNRVTARRMVNSSQTGRLI